MGSSLIIPPQDNDQDKDDVDAQNIREREKEDPLINPDICEVLGVFPDQDPGVLYDIYCQVGRNKNLLLETIMNGGVLPDELDEEEGEDENEADRIAIMQALNEP